MNAARSRPHDEADGTSRAAAKAYGGVNDSTDDRDGTEIEELLVCRGVPLLANGGVGGRSVDLQT